MTRTEKLARKLFDYFTKAHVAVYRRSDGRFGTKFFRGAPCCLVDHVGRKTGAKRTTPLIYARDGASIVLVASNGGHPRSPAWFHNLREMDETTAQVGREHLRVRPRVADETERERVWPLATAVWPDYDAYQRRTDRTIPVLILEPIR